MSLFSCPSGCNDSSELLIDFGNVPRSGVLLGDPNQPVPMVALAFEFCSQCGLIRRRPCAAFTEDYQHVDRTTGHQLPVYTADILGAIRQKGVRNQDFVVEVGANDGTFLTVLAQMGFTNLLGIEPSHHCAAVCRAKGHRVQEAHLDVRQAALIRNEHGPAGLVICRHVFEHVPAPLDFLIAVKRLLKDDGVLFIEVPDARGIVRDLRGHQLWEEHINMFSLDNLPFVACRAGFNVDAAWSATHLDLRSNLFWCLPTHSKRKEARVAGGSLDLRDCRLFRNRWGSISRRIHECMSNLPLPIVGLGAGHPQTNFFLFAGVGRLIGSLVDDDPAKTGRYAPIPQPVPVISTDDLLSGKPPGAVVRSAFGYPGWMDRICNSLAARGTRIIDPDADFIKEEVLTPLSTD